MRVCGSYLGVDGSTLIVREANAALTGRAGRVVRGHLEDFEAEADSFDLIDNFFVEGARPKVWLGADSVWQHRTIETYVTELGQAGFPPHEPP
jgi:hypothetical protein